MLKVALHQSLKYPPAPKRGLPYNDLDAQMLNLIKQHPGITTRELQQKLSQLPIANDTIIRHAKKLEQQGLIVRAKHTYRWQHYDKNFQFQLQNSVSSSTIPAADVDGL